MKEYKLITGEADFAPRDQADTYGIVTSTGGTVSMEELYWSWAGGRPGSRPEKPTQSQADLAGDDDGIISPGYSRRP